MRLFWRPLALVALLAAAASAPAVEQLQLLSEHRVDGMPAGQLSGLAWCGDALMAVSDRVDDRLYRLTPDPEAEVWSAEEEAFSAPSAPARLPWGLRMRNQAAGLLRGGYLDFEDIACDAAGNRYLVSEAEAAVLRVPQAGEAQWLALPATLVRQARAAGMLVEANAMFEGLAVDPAAQTLWLAAERRRRGLLVLHRQRDTWACQGGCVLLSEGGTVAAADPLGEAPEDFSGLSWHADRLFSLERQAQQICRRDPASGARERCWSYAELAQAEPRRYPTDLGQVEALVVDEQGAWLGTDTNGLVRADGERRPVIWRVAAPARGWLQR